MAVSTSGGVACRVSYRRMVDIYVAHQLAVDICTLALLSVADVIRDELFAGVQHMIFFLNLSVCDSRVDRMWRQLAC